MHPISPKRLWSKLLLASGLFCIISLLCSSFIIETAEATKRTLKISKTNIPKKNKQLTAIVIDAQTGTILYEENAHSRRCPASMTKMMTLYLVFQELKHGRMRFDTQLKVSRHAASQKPTKLGLQAGTTISVRDAILATVTKSANDAASALAEAISGTEQKFVKLMNHTAKKLGLKNTVFINASGWPDDKHGVLDPHQISTAHDMAKLAQLLIKDFPEHYKLFSTQRFSFRGKTHKNTNTLLGKIEGLDGLKTGFWRGGGTAGCNLTSSAKRGKTRIIAVVMSARTPQERNNKMTELVEKGFLLALSQVPAKTDKITLAQNQTKQAKTSQKHTALNLENLQEILNETPLIPSSGDSSDKKFDQELALVLRQEEATLASLESNPSSISHPLPPRKPFKTTKKKLKAPFGKTQDLPPLTVSESNKQWAVQVGAFASSKIAQDEGKKISQKFSTLFKGKHPKVYPPKKGGKKQFPVRFLGFSKSAAAEVCQTLSSQKKPCLIIAPHA